MQQAAGQEAEKQVAAVAADLQDTRAVVAKLHRAAEAQQQHIEGLQVGTFPTGCTSPPNAVCWIVCCIPRGNACSLNWHPHGTLPHDDSLFRLQAKLHVAVNADTQHEAALIALKEVCCPSEYDAEILQPCARGVLFKHLHATADTWSQLCTFIVHSALQEHAKHLADSVRADRSVREEGAAPTGPAAAGGRGSVAEQRADGGGSSGSGKQSGRKHGAALLPRRGKGRESVAGSGAVDRLSNGSDGGGQSLAQRAGLRGDEAAVDGGSGSSNGSTDLDGSLSQGGGASDGDSSGNSGTGKGANSAELDPHARQQVRGLAHLHYSNMCHVLPYRGAGR